jgi:hypothetical protein
VEESSYWYSKARNCVIKAFSAFAQSLATKKHTDAVRRDREFSGFVYALRRELLAFSKGMANHTEETESVLITVVESVHSFLEGKSSQKELEQILKTADLFLDSPEFDHFTTEPEWPEGPGTMEGVCGMCGGEKPVRWLVDPRRDKSEVSDRDPWCMRCYSERGEP